MTPRRPVVGVIGSAHTVEGKFTAQRVGERNLRAVAEAAGALPLMFAGTPEITDIGALLGICRGLQEMNVAFGGSLHPEIRDLPGRMNHRMPRLPNGEIHPDLEVIFADRHDVRLKPGGVFAKLLGAETIRVNSLHGQGILEPGQRVVVEGVAEDETIEAIAIADAPSFALGVQWHAEHDANRNPINRKLFEAFGKALVKYRRAL